MKNAIKILGRTKLEEATGTCEHCGRDIKHLVFLSNGKTVGQSCALTMLGYSRATIDSTPFVVSDLSKAAGFCATVMVDGKIMRATRSYSKDSPTGYTKWILSVPTFQE